MRISSIRFATWMCLLALAGCAADSSATAGSGGGVPIDETGEPIDPWAQPQEPDPNDPWAQPEEPDPTDPWAQPQDPNNPWSPPPPPAATDPWGPPPPPVPTDPWAPPPQPNPNDPWAQPQDPNDPWAEPQDPQPPEEEEEEQTGPQDPQQTEPWDPRPPQPDPNAPWMPPQPNPNDPWAQPQEPNPTDPWAAPAPPADPALDPNQAVVPPSAECPRGAADFDEDGLCDTAEARYGTHVQDPDSDDDALSDGMEVYGIAYQGRVLDLAAAGANPVRKDVFVEIDWVQGYRPTQSALGRVTQSFAAVGVSLHLEFGQELIMDPNIPVHSVSQVDVDFKQPNLDPLRAFAYRWALFARSYNNDTSSGVAPYSNSWLIVTLGTFEFKSQADRIAAEAGTFMHELGHTFRLFHGGVDDDTNFKPNHMSVMNYHYQFTGVWRDGAYVLDYASIAVNGVNEESLSETDAFAPGEGTTDPDLARYTTPRVCLSLIRAFCNTPAWLGGNLSQGLDFNLNQVVDSGPIAVDLNGNGSASDHFQPVYNEWNSLDYSAGDVIGNLKPQVRRNVDVSGFATCQSAPNAQL